MTRDAFIAKAQALGYKTLPFADGRVMVAGMAPEHAAQFVADGVKHTSWPRGAQRVEVLWLRDGDVEVTR